MSMSILINGMEMPKSCGNCFFDTHCDKWRLRNWGAPPPDDCPLVPVPPHGRLIDGDELCDGLVSNHPVVIYAKSAPTIIPAEEGE